MKGGAEEGGRKDMKGGVHYRILNSNIDNIVAERDKEGSKNMRDLISSQNKKGQMDKIQ